MEQDILFNTKAGDALLGDTRINTIYYDGVWGGLFSSDNSDVLYLNICVPYKIVRSVKYSEDGVYYCDASIPYKPDLNQFVVRLITIVDGEYQTLEQYNALSPKDSFAYAYVNGASEGISACQLPMIDINGKFHIVFYLRGDYSCAYIYSASETDFMFGASDDQSAQLLAICAPGKYYKYPTSGVDITKYINSVVSHTDIATNLFEQFRKDNKGVYDAEFDSSTGILNVGFNSTESVDESAQALIDVENLDIDVFRIATDEYIRSIMEACGVFDKDAFILSISSYDKVLFMKNVGGVSGELIDETKTDDSYLDYDNIIEGDSDGYCVVTSAVSAGTFLRFELNDTDIYPTNLVPVFNLVDSDNNVVYEQSHLDVSENGDCALVLQDLTLNYYIHPDDLVNGYGIYRISDEDALKDMVVITSDDNGRMFAVLTNESRISDVRYDHITGSVIALKNIENE